MRENEIKGNFDSERLEIIDMAKKDREMRLQYSETGKLDEQLDKSNTEKLKEIVSQIGWPTISKVGVDASYEAWLLIQHSPDIDFQKQCLELMKQEKDGEIDKENIAYLEDRIRVREGKKQIYGTQYIRENGKRVLLPIEDPQKADHLRREMGIDII